jgi:hypothetical protein
MPNIMSIVKKAGMTLTQIIAALDPRYVKITDLPTSVPANETDPLSLHTNGDNTTGLTIDLETTGEITGEMAKVSATAPDEVVGNLWLDPSGGSGGSGGGVTDHSDLNELDYASSGHTGFEPAITAGTTSQVFLGDKSLAAITAVGGMTLVDTASPSAAANFTISGLAPATRYYLIFNYEPSTYAALTLGFNADTGNNYSYIQRLSGGTGTSVSNGASGGVITVNGSAKEGYATQIIMEFQTSSANSKKVSFMLRGVFYNTGFGTWAHRDISGYYAGAADLSSLTFTASTGTMTGTAKLYKMN